MDYITKRWSNDELLAQVAQAVESRRLRDENVQLKRPEAALQFSKHRGQNDKMQVLLDLSRRSRLHAPRFSSAVKRHG